MTASNIQDQEGNVQAPRANYVMCQAVNATSHSYDMRVLVFPDENATQVKQGNVNNSVWVDLEAIGGDIYFLFDSAALGTNTIDDTQVNAAGTPWSLATTNPTGWTYGGGATVLVPAHIPTGTFRPVRINRNVDITLHLKCSGSGTATLRMSPSSQSLPGATLGS